MAEGARSSKEGEDLGQTPGRTSLASEDPKKEDYWTGQRTEPRTYEKESQYAEGGTNAQTRGSWV